MSTGIKNGKDHAFNICSIFLFLFLTVPCIPAMPDSGVDNPKVRVIVIDAGHGGKDPGALGSSSREKDITLAIALRTGEYIEKNIKNSKVIYTRNNDTFIELRDRPKIANKANADLFISIHANSAQSKTVKGAETYVMGHAKDQANLEVAMNENSAMLHETDYLTKYQGFDPKSSESYIMFSLTQEVFSEQSTDLATRIQKQFRERVNRNDRDVKQAGFWVLFNTKMPSVLIETGFITNPEEEKYLNSREGQDYLASSIFRACREYFNSVDSRSGLPVEKIAEEEIKPDSEAIVVPEHAGVNPDQPAVKQVALPSVATNQPADTSQIENEISFMVQVKSSTVKKEIKPENFKGLMDIIQLGTPGIYKYASGKFGDYNSAANYRKKMQLLYPDAFVIAVKDNKTLPLQQAFEEKKKTQK